MRNARFGQVLSAFLPTHLPCKAFLPLLGLLLPLSIQTVAEQGET